MPEIISKNYLTISFFYEMRKLYDEDSGVKMINKLAFKKGPSNEMTLGRVTSLLLADTMHTMRSEFSD